MKCLNKDCGGEWTPPPGKSITVCPFCGEPIAKEKKPTQSFDNVADTLVYIKEQLSIDTLLNEKVYTYFADLTRNQFRDEKDLIKQLCDKGALDCLKAAIGKPASEHDLAIKRALSKLPKYLQDSPAVTDMLNIFAVALGWRMGKPSLLVNSIHEFADIDWRVLAVENNKALLISEEILEKRPYNVEYKDTTWETCTLRKYLNGEFYNKLGAVKSSISDTPNSNPNNPWYGITGGSATTDKVFLLSLDELVKYFGDSGALEQKQGKDIKYFCWENSKWNEITKPDTSKWCFFHDQYSNARIAKDSSGGASWWWLRSPGLYSGNAAFVFDDGSVDVDGDIVSNDFGGVRPALWLNL